MENHPIIQNLAFTDEEFEKVEKQTPSGFEEKEGKVLNNRYKKIVKLGEGSFNTVYLA